MKYQWHVLLLGMARLGLLISLSEHFPQCQHTRHSWAVASRSEQRVAQARAQWEIRHMNAINDA
jgi:hypothetical protein